jgi:hypothetical protein
VTISVVPDPEAVLVSWHHAGCSNSSASCVVIMNGNQSITVEFAAPG